ncbi:diguanylate cyclase [Christensenellaceae bacterium OttesenSCG-928-L17]|nr:diguanylate cyclase [Christensenellaceae bacterium OttesenSCG-928-L17]
MTNEICLLLYSPLIIANVLLLVALGSFEKHNAIRVPYIWFSVVLLCWQITEALIFVLDSPAAVRYCYDLKLAFVPFAAVLVFWLTAHYHKIANRFPKYTLPVLLVLSVVIGIMAVTSPLHSLLRTSITVVATEPLVIVEQQRGIGFYMVYAFAQAMVLLIAFVVVRAHRNLPTAFKSGTIFLYAGLIVYVICSVIEGLYPLTGIPIDFHLIGTGLCQVMLYLATFTHGYDSYRHIKKSEAFNYMDEGVFVLNNDDHIADYNLPARRMLALLGVNDPESKTFQSVLDLLVQKGKLITRRHDESQGLDLYVPGESYPQIYSMRTRPYYDQHGLPDGRFVIITGVTQSRLSEDRLHQLNGIDTLTGLPNRYHYQEMLRQLDTQENLPLSLITCSMHSLRHINHRYGYYEGDLLLKSVADVLKDRCPVQGLAARTGGEQFSLLLPRCTGEEAEKMVESILLGVQHSQSVGRQETVLCGYAVKTQPEVNINLLPVCVHQPLL